MGQTIGVAKLLEELERQSGDDAQAARKAIWEELLPYFGTTSHRDLISELVQELDVQPVTVRRWLSGSFAPRQHALAGLRQHFGLLSNTGAAVRAASPDQPVPFAGSLAGLRTVNHFFYCLERAKSCFVFKGMLGFHAGRSQQVREHVVRVLGTNSRLKMYYIFPERSEAQATFDRFHKSTVILNPEVAPRIIGIPIPQQDDAHPAVGLGQMGLGTSLASPFVILYDQLYLRDFRRPLDVWYELPVEQLTANNESADSGDPLYVFVQMPSHHADGLWDEWVKLLDATSGIEKDDLEFSKSGEQIV